MLNQKRVSVVIANYNNARFLPQPIDSVLSQTYPAHEMIVVDDGSSDDSCRILRPYESEPSVPVHFQENSGQSRAENQSIT
jgi:glycosyltransferase involved in cell wall biosynthesis